MVKGHKVNIGLRRVVREELSTPVTDEQFRIVRQSPRQRLLVTAGPGTGKTHVLVARLEALVCFYDVKPGSELLVLSFSRAAVREIKDRVKAAGGDVAHVRAFTFDSFATRLLSQFEPDGNWTTEDYDPRIEAATRLIRSNAEAREFLRSYLHILVDEVQDLVGIRADFVQTVLREVKCGFTLLGDPAQGIYNFSLKDDPHARRVGSQALYAALRSEHSETLREFELSENHRVKTSATGRFLWAGPKLNRLNADYRQIAGRLLKEVNGLRCLGTIEEACRTLRDVSASTVLLTRDNGQALLVSRKLSEAAVDHVLRQRATERIVAPWIGRLFGQLTHLQITRTQFLRLAEDPSYGIYGDPQELWDLVKRAERTAGPMLNLKSLSERLFEGNIPDELTHTLTTGVTVSTVHRAKGLEFDRVILVDPVNFLESEWLPEEARVLYVALTRAKSEILRVRAPNTYGLFRWPPDDEGRWVRRYGSWKTESVEVRGDDTDYLYPPGTHLFTEDALALQEYLFSHVHPGDCVKLRLVGRSTSGDPRVYYTVVHDGRQIGVTSDVFGADLFRALKLNSYWRVRWPEFIDDLRVQAVDTVTGSQTSARRAGLNEAGIWLRVRVVGLGRARGDWE